MSFGPAIPISSLLAGQISCITIIASRFVLLTLNVLNVALYYISSRGMYDVVHHFSCCDFYFFGCRRNIFEKYVQSLIEIDAHIHQCEEHPANWSDPAHIKKGYEAFERHTHATKGLLDDYSEYL